MLSFFDSNKPFLVFPLLLLSLLLHVRLFFEGVSLVDVQAQAPIALSIVAIFDLKNGMPIWLIFFLSSILLFLAALVFNQFFTDSKFIERQSYLPAYSYILIGSYFPEFLQLQPMLVGNIIFLLALSQLFSAYNPGSAFKAIYNSGFLIALAALFYYPFLLVVTAVFLILLIIRGFIWREWLLALLGVLSPFYFVASYYYISGQFLTGMHFELIPKMQTISQMINQMNWLDYAQIILLLIILPFALFKIQSNYLSSHIKTRKYFNAFYWLFAFCFIAALAEFPPNLKQFMILSVPLSFAFTYLIMSLENKRWAKALNIIMLFAIIVGQYYRLLF